MQEPLSGLPLGSNAAIAMEAAAFQRQLEIIQRAAKLAQAKIDYQSAHSDTVLRSIEVVEAFLRRRHRICYGGQAINAYLPAKYKFYDPEYSIPDYDFFTPAQMTDLEELVRDLARAGFSEISAREGMHEGTIKLYVDYIPVADLTALAPAMFRGLAQKAERIDGISYIDRDSLRMLMYLELSRPRGEVERWPKVYERLMLFNEFVPPAKCHKVVSDKGRGLTASQLDSVLRFVVGSQRVFAGGDVLGFYEGAAQGRKEVEWLVGVNRPVVFYSPEPQTDAREIMGMLKGAAESDRARGVKLTTLHHQGLDEIPSIWAIHRGKTLLVLIVEQSACHSYVSVPLKADKEDSEGSELLVASIDTLVTLYFSLGFVKSSFVDRGAMNCLANQMVELSIRARRTPEKFVFPFVSIRCAGHQTTMPSLIRAKIQRMSAAKKRAIQNVLFRGTRKAQRARGKPAKGSRGTRRRA
jgi:hypothetical protein